MTRDIRVIPTLALTVTGLALLLFVVQYPSAAMWACVVALILAVAGLFTLAAETVELRKDDADKDRRIADLADDNAALTAALAEQTAAQAAAGVPLRLVAERPDLRVIPKQRVSDDDWFARLYDENGDARP